MRSANTSVLIFVLGSSIAVMLFLGAGCSPQYHKEDADKEVYQIIEGKWRDDFGGQANYRIDDVNRGPNDILITKGVPEDGMLGLKEAVVMATRYNRPYQRQKEELYLSALSLTLVRYDFQRQWFATIDGAYVRDSEDEQISSSKEVRFEQLLADGASIAAAVAIDWARFLTGSPGTSLNSVLSATITQPLLRGAGRDVVQENLTQAERNVLYQIRAFNRFRKSFVVSIVSDYYRILQLRDAVTNTENDYKRRVASRQRLEAEAEAGQIPPFQVDQARQSEFDALDANIRAQQVHKQRLDEFKIRLALPTDANVSLDQQELIALVQSGVKTPEFSVEVAIETAILRRLDLATTRDSVDDAGRKVMVAVDSLRSEINLIGGINVDSAGKTDFGKLEFERGTYTLGLGLDLPLDRKAERNAYRRSLIALLQSQREYEQAEDEVKLDVRRAYRDLELAAQQYEIQQNSLKLAERRVESTKMLLEAGEADTRDLLESQDSLLRAQNRLTGAVVEHAIAKLSFFRDVEILQVRPDGMWLEYGKGNQAINEEERG